MTDTMVAAVLKGPCNLVVEKVKRPIVSSGQVVIDVSACSISNNDLKFWISGRGKIDSSLNPFIMGHDFCGVVSDPGESDLKIGERVVFWPKQCCGACHYCRKEKELFSDDIRNLNNIDYLCNGAFAQSFVGSIRHAFRIPHNISDLTASLLDPVILAYNAISRGKISRGQKVLIVGNDFISALAAELAKISGAECVAMVYENESKIELIRSMGFVDIFIQYERIVQQRADIIENKFDAVFDLEGHRGNLESCITACRPGGSIVFISNNCTHVLNIDLFRASAKNITFIGGPVCTYLDLHEALSLLEKGIINPEKYINLIINLNQLQQTMERLNEPNNPFLKVVVLPN